MQIWDRLIHWDLWTRSWCLDLGSFELMAYSQKLVAQGLQYPIKGRDRKSVPRTCARRSLKLTKLLDSCRPFSIEEPVSPVAPRRSTFCLTAISQFRGLWEFEGGTDYQIDDPKLKSDINPGVNSVLYIRIPLSNGDFLRARFLIQTLCIEKSVAQIMLFLLPSYTAKRLKRSIWKRSDRNLTEI